MESDTVSNITPFSNTLSDQEEAAQDRDKSASQMSLSAASDSSTPASKESRGLIDTATMPAVGESQRRGVNETEAAILSEVQTSLRTIGNGVTELVSTVNDLLGFDDNQDSPSPDSSSSEEDNPRQFSWNRFMNKATERRHIRQERSRQAAKKNIPLETEDELRDLADEGREKIPKIRVCNFEQFKSRPAEADHKLYCVDVLVAGDRLDDEIEDFKSTIAQVKSGNLASWKPAQEPQHADDLSSDPDSEKWIRRIRINSSAVLKMLETLRLPDCDRYGHHPRVFYRPFSFLVLSYEDMKVHLTRIKELVSCVVDEGVGSTDSTAAIMGATPGDLISPRQTTISPTKRPTTQTQERDTEPQSLSMEKQLAELECFMEFMEQQIMPVSRQYQTSSPPAAETIRYEDLWHLFRPGALCYIQRNPSQRNSFFNSPSAQSFCRISSVSCTPLSGGVVRRPHAVSPSWCQAWAIWDIRGYYVDHDGTHYRSVYVPIHIAPFRGKVKVTDLQFYPLPYLGDKQILEQARSDGAIFANLIDRRFGFYSGWTQTTDPLGERLTEFSKRSTRSVIVARPEHIESDVLVDFEETFNAMPSWKTNFDNETWRLRSNPKLFPRRDDVEILEWHDTGEVACNFGDRYNMWDSKQRACVNKFIEEDPYQSENNTTPPTGDHLALLPRRFFAYAVLERKFVQLNTRWVRNADRDEKAFEKLEINKKHKSLVLALVKSHFDKIAAEKKLNVEIDSQDLIRGKGKGVVILLHGVPGVGKTATAEAVALKWKKPLFPITCGDLGFTAESLEKSLNEIFRLAHHWGCILLLDEADVFITQRERNDLQRNALVSGESTLSILAPYELQVLH